MEENDFASRFVAEILKYQLWIAGVLIAGFVGGIGYFTYNWYDNSQEIKAREAIFAVEDRLNKLRDQHDKKPDFDKEIKPVVEDLKAVIIKNKTTKAALGTAMSLADYLMSENKLAEAQNVLEQAVEKKRSGDLLVILAQMQIANLLAAQNNFAAALAHYQSLLSTSEAQFMMSEILLRMGLCAQKQGQMDQAKSYYSRIATEFAESEAAAQAKNYLRLIQLQGT